MKVFGRVMLSVLLAGLVLSFSFSSVQANKRVFKASISFANELGTVVGSSAKGTGSFSSNPDGSIYFLISVRGLTSAPGGAHIHGPADATQNAPVLGTLCGAGPNPGIYATCTLDSSGVLVLEGTINGSVLQSWGVSGADFFNWLDSGLLYVNFHTALNPAGEARGQILPR